MTLIGRGVKPRDCCHSGDYRTECRPAVRKILATMPESLLTANTIYVWCHLIRVSASMRSAISL